MIRTFIALASAVALSGLASAFPGLPAAKSPAPAAADFRGVDQAVSTSVKEPAPGAFGAIGYLGVTVKRDAGGKPIVDQVQANSPAAKAGMKSGDLIAAVDKQPVLTPDAFRERLQAYPAEVPIKLTIIRDGKTIDVTATPTATSHPLKLGPSAYAGVQLGQVKEGEEIRVVEVAANSPAQTAGIKIGDVLHKLEGLDVGRPGALNEMLREKRPGDVITLVFAREGKELEVKVTLRAQQGGGPGGGGFALTLWKKPEMKVAIIGVEFTEIKHNDKISPADVEKLVIGTGAPSLNDYLREVSAGQFHLDGKFIGWIDVGKKRADYAQGSGVSNRTAVLKDAVDKLLAKDKDAIKERDAIVFVYAGEEVRGNPGSVYYPHAGVVQVAPRQGSPYFFFPEGGSKLTSVGTLVKPCAQMLGLPDLSARRENIGSEGLGIWCATSDATTTGKRLHLGPWAKEKLGWLKPTVIDPNEKQKLVLAPIEGSKRECFKVLIRTDGSEYLLLENRKKTGFDAELPGEGMLIWRVVNDRPLLEESHGVTGPSGPTVFLSSVPYPSASNNAFTPNTTPSSRSPLGGGLPVHITNIKRLPDGRVSFQIGREYD